MARLVLGQLLGHPAHDRAELRLLERSPDAESVEAKGGEVARCLAAKVLVLRALNHPEQRLVRPVTSLEGEPLMLDDAPLRPLEGAVERPLLVLAGVHEGRALVEREHDVGADLVLHLHRHLRGEPV